MVYIRVNEISTPRRNGGGSAALAEPLLSSGHRAFATDSSSCPAPRSPVGRHATARPLAGARAAENLPPASEARASGFPFLPCARKRLADCDRQRGSAQGGARKEKEVPDGKQGDHHHAREEGRALPALERRPRHRRAAASVLRAPGLPPAQLRQLRWARICQVVGNFFGGTLSVGIGPYTDDASMDPGDNGITSSRAGESSSASRRSTTRAGSPPASET